MCSACWLAVVVCLLLLCGCLVVGCVCLCYDCMLCMYVIDCCWLVGMVVDVSVWLLFVLCCGVVWC